MVKYYSEKSHIKNFTNSCNSIANSLNFNTPKRLQIHQMSHTFTGPRKNKRRHRQKNKKKLPQKPLPAPTHDNDSFTVTPQGPSAAATGDACSAMKRHALAADEKTQQVTESNLHKFRTAANAAVADLETDIVDLEIKKKKSISR
eukprot:67332_1